MTGGKNIVFVVDDDLAVRESLKFSLELEGLIVHVCATGAELLRHADLPQARCLVLDAQMPLTDTFEILDGLTALRARLPVILLTSRATAALRLRAAAAGVRYILEKPLLDNSLLARIQDVLSDKRQAMPLPG
jgi:two-component system, LuxR family, response regulator FixJ